MAAETVDTGPIDPEVIFQAACLLLDKDPPVDIGATTLMMKKNGRREAKLRAYHEAYLATGGGKQALRNIVYRSDATWPTCSFCGLTKHNSTSGNTYWCGDIKVATFVNVWEWTKACMTWAWHNHREEEVERERVWAISRLETTPPGKADTV